jgi:hypothetical protein
VTKRGTGAAAALICIVFGAFALLSPVAGAATTFKPRIRGALGLVPIPGGPEIATGTNLPLVYHGGSVMRNVTIHTIFWAPAGYRFGGPPSAGTLGYEQLMQRFFTDAAHDSGGSANLFSVQTQYPDSSGPGQYSIKYNAAVNSVDATDPYPPASRQCASPQGVATCVTDLQLQQEIDHVIQSTDPTARGLSDLWFIFLPPDVDTCVMVGSCGTNVYGGYHGSSNLGHGVTFYSVIPDPLIEAAFPAGADPQGNPDAESAINTAAHETVEAVTDPLGVGWMDPNGNEVADKCQVGPQFGPPLGYAADGSPYNQVINGDKWLIQTAWSNARSGCVQSSTASTSPLPLPKVRLTQFSSSVSGSIGAFKPHVGVIVRLLRAGTLVGVAAAQTRSSGAWGPVSLTSLTRASRVAFGDDRDEIVVSYGPGGPSPDVILTGDGGNAFTQSGWTGWFDLNNGFSVANVGTGGGVLLGPCSQTGVLLLTVGRSPTQSPNDVCGTETDVSVVRTGRLAGRTALHLESTDNRAVSALSPNGALVSLRVPLGEADSVSALGNALVPFAPSGFPLCTADLQAQRVSCSGLVPRERYTLTRSRGHASVHARAGADGWLAAAGFAGSHGITGGDVVTLRNSAHRTLTALHVAHLRVNIIGERTVLASGTCEAGEYYGRPPASPPTNKAIGPPGIAGTGTICPRDGRARGLPVAHIEQTDDRSGGMTSTAVPRLRFTSPTDGATLYGPFVALAGAGIPTPDHAVIPAAASVALTITDAAGGPVVFRAANVTAGGVAVNGLAPGTYAAKWVLTDANGDTRTVLTRFVEAG